GAGAAPAARAGGGGGAPRPPPRGGGPARAPPPPGGPGRARPGAPGGPSPPPAPPRRYVDDPAPGVRAAALARATDDAAATARLQHDGWPLVRRAAAEALAARCATPPPAPARPTHHDDTARPAPRPGPLRRHAP